MTRDGIPVILHDSPLDRTTAGHGRVSEKPLVPSFPAGSFILKGSPNPLDTALAAGAYIILPRFNLVDTQMVGRAKAHGLKVLTLTLNTGVYISAAVAFGVDGFATTDPCQTEEILKSLAS